MSDRVAFSNGTMFDIWSANWCDRCLKDAPFRNMGKGSGCPILLKVLGDNEVPPEWLVQDAVARYGTASAAREATGIPLDVLGAAEARMNEAVAS